MKNKILSALFKRKFSSLLAFLFVFGLGSLKAQTLITQTMVNDALSGSGIINITGNAVITENISARNNAIAKTLTIKATGDVKIDGNIDLSGEDGNPINYTNIHDGSSGNRDNDAKNGHKLVIETVGNLTISGIINTIGGKGVKTNAGGWFEEKYLIGGNGGNAGDIEINSGGNLIINNSVKASGGNAGASQNEGGHVPAGIAGNAGKVTITSAKVLTINNTITVDGAESTDTEAAGGNAGSITINGYKVDITSVLSANGGSAGTRIAGVLPGENGGDAGVVTINSNTTLTISSISVNGGNGASNSPYAVVPVGVGGNAGNVIIDAKTNIFTTGVITAHGGNAGQYARGAAYHFNFGVVISKKGGNITINSNDGSVTIGGSIIANGGDGTAQPVSREAIDNRVRIGSDAGTGGIVTITSCGNISLAAAEVNGGYAVNLYDINHSEVPFQAGSGGNGGQVLLASSTGNVSIGTITVNGIKGADVENGVNAGCEPPYNGRANHGGWGGLGGTIDIQVPQGIITINTKIEANGGQGGTGATQACSGGGGNAGSITGVYSEGTLENHKILLLGGNIGSNQTINKCQCIGQSGKDGVINIILQPYSGPTINCGNIIPPTCTQCPGSFAPIPGKEYIISGWVKDAGLYNSNEEISNYNHSISVCFDIAGQQNEMVLGDFVPGGSIIDGWQRIYGEFMVPQNAYKIRIKLKNNTGGSEVYFDDIRVHPIDGSMKSYVYDPETLRLVAELDDENYATFYEYDEEGALIRIKKETERGVMTIREARQGRVKNF